MANAFTSFWQTVVAAASEASQLLAPTWNALDSVYLDYKPLPATIGQTINVPIPQDPTNAVNDIGAGDVTISDVGFSTVPIVFDRHPNFAFVVRDFEQFNSPQQIRSLFMDAAMKGVKNHINQNVANLFTTANFTTNTAIPCTSSVISVTQFTQGLAKLADQRVPVQNDPDNMNLVLPSVPYAAMMDASSTAGGFWAQARITGGNIAESIRSSGVMVPAFGCRIKLDQQMPTSGASPSRTFTAAYLHRWAVAVVSRDMPPPDSKVVDYMYMPFGGISLRISIGYNQYPKQGYVVNVDAGYGLKVVRENMCQLFTIAE
jgi:hypothetical protein